MNDPGRVVIIGAGPTGLGAAHRLRELGHTDFLVLERSATAGGLAGSYLDANGFTWDNGGHVQFSHYAYYDGVLDRLPLRWFDHQRESWIWFRKRFVPYPFQNNIHHLDPEDCLLALRGIEAAAEARPAAPPPANFREWILHTFGTGVADLFLLPYNLKVWGYPPEMLSARWVGERVAVPDVDRIRRNVREQIDDVSWGPNNTFRFPQRGGTGAIWRALAATFDENAIVTNAAVEAIALDDRTVRLRDGRILHFDTLITSIPLRELARIASPLSPQLRDAAESLLYSSTHIFGIGLRGPMPAILERKCWMYFPEAHSPYYRVTVFSNYSRFNVPDGEGYWSLMAEVCETPLKRVNAATIFDEVIAAMRADALIGDSHDVVSRWHRFEPYGYPIPGLLRDEALPLIHAELEQRRVFSRGRFGAWKYEVSNQDHSFMQGVELVNRLTEHGEEITLDRPDYANSGVFLKR